MCHFGKVLYIYMMILLFHISTLMRKEKKRQKSMHLIWTTYLWCMYKQIKIWGFFPAIKKKSDYHPQCMGSNRIIIEKCELHWEVFLLRQKELIIMNAHILKLWLFIILRIFFSCACLWTNDLLFQIKSWIVAQGSSNCCILFFPSFFKHVGLLTAKKVLR